MRHALDHPSQRFFGAAGHPIVHKSILSFP